MRILFCTNSIGVIGGIARVTIVKANALAEIEGNEVAICFTDRGTYPDKMVHPLSSKVQVYDLETPYWPLTNLKKIFRHFLPTVFRTRKAIKKIIKEFRPDVVITTGTYEKFALASIPSKGRFIKIREFHFASTYRRFLPEKSFQTKLNKQIEFLENKLLPIFFHKNFLLSKRDKLENFKSSSHFDYMYNPSSFPPISEVENLNNNREKIVLVVARLAPQKHVDELIFIWNLIYKLMPDWKLRIVGSGSDEHMIRMLIKELGLENNIDLIGSSTQIREEMKKASIFAMTSRYEGFGLTLVEAQSMGLPIVTYNCNYGPDEIVNDGRDGYIISINNKDLFGDALVQIASNPDLWTKMSKAAIERSKAFLPEVIASQWMEKYDELLKRTRNRDL